MRINLSLILVPFALTCLQCSGDDSAGSGGSVNVGGSNAGGAANTGGATNSGGSANTGGTMSTGTGGAGAGGAGGSSSSDGGSAGSGGSGGSGGMPAGDGAAGSMSDAGRLDSARADAVADGSPRDASSEARFDASDAAVEGALAYNPCPPAGQPCKIMPLGDSITDGFTPLPGGYRIQLFHLMLAAGKHATFVGRNLNGPAMVDGVTFPQNHEGYSGFTIDPGAGRMGISMPTIAPAAVQTQNPDIILLMIGTNDVNLDNDVANAPTRLGALLDAIFQIKPTVMVILAQITPTRLDAVNARITPYNAAMSGLVQQRVAMGRHIQLVDMNGAFMAFADYRTSQLADDLHPNPTGYSTMAGVWYTALAPLLN